MQGVAAHDLIEHEEQYLPHKQEPRAVLAGSPRARLAAKAREPEPHGPSVTEREVGAELHPDPHSRLGHPGLACRDLPAGHAHRLPAYKEARDLQNPSEAEAPLLVAPAGQPADEAAAEQE